METPMRIEKDGKQISCITDWEDFAPPKGKKKQWVKGRSAYELARAWCGAGIVSMPRELRTLFDSRQETEALKIDCVTPEQRITFDSFGGEPRNADLAFVGQTSAGGVAVTVEAKADEPFGETVAETLAAALERLDRNPKSRGLRRIECLVKALFIPQIKGMPNLADLRYQLMTATAGTLAYALQNKADRAVLIIHEFITTKTLDERHAMNRADYDAFIYRLSGEKALADITTGLLGPYKVPGKPLFENAPELFVGKVSTRLR
jgi:hypothetical protein